MLSAKNKIALILHIVAELVTGLLLVFSPQVFSAGNLSLDHSEAIRGIGNGAISIGFVGLGLLISPAKQPWAYGIMAQYHLGVVILQWKHPLPGVPLAGALAFHGPLLCYFTSKAIGGERSHTH